MTITHTNPPDKSTSPKCAHLGCHCSARPGQKYCSEYCENMMGSDICGCGHDECKNSTENRS
jgi:hypothetical protein